MPLPILPETQTLLRKSGQADRSIARAHRKFRPAVPADRKAGSLAFSDPRDSATPVTDQYPYLVPASRPSQPN